MADHEGTGGVGGMMREWRVHRGLSIRQLSAVARISAATICNVEAGKHDPQLGTLTAMASALGLSCSVVLEEVPGP